MCFVSGRVKMDHLAFRMDLLPLVFWWGFGSGFEELCGGQVTWSVPGNADSKAVRDRHLVAVLWAVRWRDEATLARRSCSFMCCVSCSVYMVL